MNQQDVSSPSHKASPSTKRDGKLYDAIIIGAGFSGLQAARTLLEQGISNILILEARDRVGGRVQHGKVASVSVDFGGMWLGPTQERLSALAKHYAIKTYPTFLSGKSVYRVDGKEFHGDREDYNGLFSVYDGLQYFLADQQLQKWLHALDCAAPWDHPYADTLDALTLQSWVNRRFRSERLRSMFKLICFSLFCAEPSQVSMLFFVHYLKSGGGLDVLISGDNGGAQNFLFEGGVHQIAEQMAADLRGIINLEEPVLSLNHTAEETEVITDRGRYSARRVIVAIPAPLVTDIAFSPALPQPKAALHRRLVMGSAIKYWIAYKSPFWRDQGFNGSVAVDDSPASPCFDVSPPSGKLGLIAGFFDGDHAIHHSGTETEKRKAIVLDMLASEFGEKALSPLDYQDLDWTRERWSRGCYGAFAPPGVISKYGKWLRPSIGPLVWAGTETASVWTGYIEGALQSGERAGHEVATMLNTIEQP